MRGLGDIYNVTDPDEEERFLAEVGCTIKHGRQTELADNVMYMCVSYKHQTNSEGERIRKRCTRSNPRMRCTCYDEQERYGWKDMGMLDSDWRDVYREAKRCALMTGVKHISLWVDKQVYRGDYSWIALGLVPYLVFPTIRSHVNGTEADRLWLHLEKACAKIGPGITSDWRDEIDMLQHLVVTRTPVESFLTISELVRGRGCDRYLDPARTTFIEDLVRLRSWADGVIRSGKASVILETPMEDLSWVQSGRRDCSHLAIYDEDLEDIELVKNYKQALRAGETPGNTPWRVEDMLLDGRATEVDRGFVEQLRKATIVTQIHEEENDIKVFLVVTITKGGCMASRVRVSYGHGDERGHVLNSWKDTRKRQEITAHLERCIAAQDGSFRTLKDYNWR
ncbi:hypothetical protein FGB62_112g110 [Gracilaria domingensis]|nr:hypothetical protein FGB62_112g110 [Gracilaria domingensis]